MACSSSVRGNGRRRRALSLLPALACAWVGAAVQAQPVVPAGCEQGVCVFNVLAARWRTGPCEGGAMLVAQAKAQAQEQAHAQQPAPVSPRRATLIQCSDPDSGESRSLLYAHPGRGRPAYLLENTRFIQPSALAELAESGVPARFGKLPLCQSPPPAQPGDLLWLQRQPGQGADAADCYALWRWSGGERAPQGPVPAGPLQPASAQALQPWAPVRQRVNAVLARQGAAACSRAAHAACAQPDSANARP